MRVDRLKAMRTARQLSYLLVASVRGSGNKLWQFLQAWCKVNRGKWAFGTDFGGFPSIAIARQFSSAGEVPLKQ